MFLCRCLLIGVGVFFNVRIFTVGNYMNKNPSKEALLFSYSLQVYIAMFRIKQSYIFSLSLHVYIE